MHITTTIPILEVQNISYSARKKAILQKVSFALEKGKIYALLGPNGAGKTTLIKAILGLIPLQEGKIRFNGKAYRPDNRIPILQKIGSLIEQASLYGHLSAYENLEQARRIYGTPVSQTARLLEVVGLAAEQRRPVKQFSMGMKQRLGIALAMIGQPELVILDEPTNGLDPQGIADFRQLILHLNQTEGTTFLMASHHLQEVEKIANDILFIRQGQIVHQEVLDKAQPIDLEALYTQVMA